MKSRARPGASRRAAVAARTRDEIVIAAARLFAANPDRLVSLQEIAAEVGLTGPALYGYFENKQAIADAMVSLMQREAAEVFVPHTTDGSSFADRLRALVRRHVALTARRCELFLALFSLRTSCKVAAIWHFRSFETWFERETGRHDLDECDPRDAVALLYGLLHAFFIREAAGEPAVGADEKIVALFWGGVRGMSAKRARR